MLDGLDHLEPDLGPEPAAARRRLVVADLDAHLELPRILADLAGPHAPERLEVVVDLVPEVFHDEGVVVLGKLVPLVEARRGVSAPALAVGGGGFREGLGRFGERGCEFLVGGLDQRVDGVPAGAAPASPRDCEDERPNAGPEVVGVGQEVEGQR